jgi:hypothetical protein
MSETVKWSFSADRCLRRCQRQFFLQHVAASHSASDTVRREAFLLKQIKTPELWHGLLVHRGIELYVVPALEVREPIDWARAVKLTAEMARRQFDFSANRRYREPGMTKGKAGDDYCALAVHETPNGVTDGICDAAVGVIEQSFTNLAGITGLLAELCGRAKYWPELKVRITYDAAFIEAHIDLLFFRSYGKPTIVDWKVSESQGGSDASSLQTALYAWALCQHPSWGVSRAEDCELLEVQLLTSTVLRHQADQSTFDRLEDRIYRSVNGMKALGIGEKFDLANIDKFDLAANPNSCAFCSVQPLCRLLLAEAPSAHTAAAQDRSRGRRKRTHVYAQPQLF